MSNSLRFTSLTTFPLLFAAISTTCLAIEEVPKEEGWSGFFLIGLGYTDLESNLVAGNTFLDIGNDTISSVFDSPESEDETHAAFAYELKYTFDNRWQAFLGTSLEDRFTLDLSQQLGLRKQLEDDSIIQFGLLFSGIPTEVWEDPYLTGSKRNETDRDASGFRFQWDKLFDSEFEFTFSYRDIEIDDERSGSDLELSAAERALLRRDGEQYTTAISYLFEPADKHFLRPLFLYRENDRDGDAFSGDTYQLQLTYNYRGSDYKFVSNVIFGSTEYDENNPIYGKALDSDFFLVDASLLFDMPSLGDDWQGSLSIAWGEDDSDVEFHDVEIMSFTAGVLYKF